MPKLVPIHKPSISYHAPKGALTHGFMGNPVRIVLHDTESHDEKGIGDIEGIVNFWMGGPDKLGSQFIVDEEGNIGQCGEPTELMFHTGGANTGSVGIEQIGFARFTKQTWEAEERIGQLVKVAKLLAWLHTEYHIPLRISTVSGVSTHAMQSKIHPESLGHTDPGTGYPLADVLGMALGYVRAGGWPAGTPGLAKPTQKPRERLVYDITYTDRKGTRKTITNHSPGLWLAAHPRAKRRADVVIHPKPRR